MAGYRTGKLGKEQGLIRCDFCGRQYATEIVRDLHKGKRLVIGWNGGYFRNCYLCPGCFAEDRELRQKFGQTPYGDL